MENIFDSRFEASIQLEAHSIENETFCSKLKLDLDIFSAYFCHMQ